jgi:hypothetical protein
MENKTLETYEAPWDVETLKKKGLERLLKTPWHRWRAETGIELIHKEPTIDEFFRIWNNWQKMSPDMKKKSDEKSYELFGMTNKEHFEALLNEYNKDTPKHKLSECCPFCDKLHTIEVNQKEYQDGIEKYSKGETIENSFPTFSKEQREFIKTGLCGRCYSQIFPE